MQQFSDRVLSMTPDDVLAHFEQSDQLRYMVDDLKRSFGGDGVQRDPNPGPEIQTEGPARWGELSEDQKGKVEKYINLLLAKQEKLPLVERAGREVVQQRQLKGITYQLEKVRCGKPNCKSCPHGPYWYAYYRKGFNGRMVSKYIGKEFKTLDSKDSK